MAHQAGTAAVKTHSIQSPLSPFSPLPHFPPPPSPSTGSNKFLGKGADSSLGLVFGENSPHALAEISESDSDEEYEGAGSRTPVSRRSGSSALSLFLFGNISLRK